MTASCVAEHVALWLGLLLALLGFGGMALLLAIQCHHTATAETRARRAEALAEDRQRQIVGLSNSVTRLHDLLRHEADQHAERLADLVSVCGTDTAEPAHERTS